MRSLVEIRKDLKFHEDAIVKLVEEVKEFQKACPHPDSFLTIKHRDYYDKAGAPVYEQTYSTASCALCSKSNTVYYDRGSGWPKYNYKEAREVISG